MIIKLLIQKNSTSERNKLLYDLEWMNAWGSISGSVNGSFLKINLPLTSLGSQVKLPR